MMARHGACTCALTYPGMRARLGLHRAHVRLGIAIKAFRIGLGHTRARAGPGGTCQFEMPMRNSSANAHMQAAAYVASRCPQPPVLPLGVCSMALQSPRALRYHWRVAVAPLWSHRKYLLGPVC